MGRAPCCEKVGLNRGPWTREEDMRLIQYIQAQGEGCWRTLPKAAGLLRCGKSCRLRWINYLRPDLKRGNISEEEDKLIIKLHSLLGNRWSLIAGRLPGRTDNEIKNYWNTHLKKKLRNMGIDPHTHLPLLQDNPTSNITTKAASKVISNVNNIKHDYVVNNNDSLSTYNKRAHSYVHHLDTSLNTSTSHPNINLISPTNKVMNKSVLSFEAKPLDPNPSHIHSFKNGAASKTLLSSSHLDPFNLLYPSSLTSLVAAEKSITHTNSLICAPSSSILATIFGTRDNPPKHLNPLTRPSSSSILACTFNDFENPSPHTNPLISSPMSSTLTCALDHFAISNNVVNGSILGYSSSSISSFHPLSPSSSSSLSTSPLSSLNASKSPSMDCNTTSPPMEFSSNMLEEVYPRTNENLTKNTLLSHTHLSPLSSSSCLTTSSMFSALSPSPSLSIDASYSYHNNCTYEAVLEHASSCYDKKGIDETMENSNLPGLTYNDMKKVGMQDLEGMTDEGEDMLDRSSTKAGNERHNKHEKMLKECSLRLMEGEVMWDMEMMHSIQEVGTPTRGSSMLTCSSYGLWANDSTYYTNDAPPLLTWLSVGDDQ